MKTYLLHRALAIIPVMLVVATVSFVLIRLAPGDPASVLAGPDATTEDLAQLRTALGMDQPLPVQLVKWYARLAQGDLGQSIFLRRPVVQAVVERLEPTLLLTLWGTLLSILIGVPAGIVSARYHNTAVDQSFMALALLGLSIPNFLLGLLMILVFGVWLGWLPVSGYVPLDEGVWLNVRSLLMPAVSLGLVQSALVARITRSSMLDVLREQYILSGRAKGVSERAVIYKHALKNILAIALMASPGPSVVNVICALGIVYVPRVVRIVRGSVLVVRETPYVEAARALGGLDLRILGRHVLPNCLSPVIVQGTFIFAAAVFGEAALSFLGVGVPPQIPSWGNVLAEGRLLPAAGAVVDAVSRRGDHGRDPRVQPLRRRPAGSARPQAPRRSRRGPGGVAGFYHLDLGPIGRRDRTT